MYDTLVNLHTGPRLLEQTLSMQSENHDGVLFDNLFLDSFGWGGDVNNALRARVDKSKWYDFRAAFRRDQNVFNYNLLANPLNPPTSSPSLPVDYSPHNFTTTRSMSDFDLTLLPQSFVTLRLGYSHNNIPGPRTPAFMKGPMRCSFKIGTRRLILIALAEMSKFCHALYSATISSSTITRGTQRGS
jgi:hypothetical protein